jgi:ABC-type dipeptide/oligopeptide/nickel transport system ATPase component
VECNTPHAIFFSPQHPFTQKLIAALPTVPSPAEIEQVLRYNTF